MGERLEDRYRVEGELGRGAMGAVLRGRARRGGQEVAIKVPLKDPSPTERARIEREAELLRRLDHPGLARLLDALADADGRLALVYELVPGRDLEAVLAGGALEPRAALKLLAGVAEGLDALHAAGLVHRDLKPANVMVRPDGSPKLLDFGLARSAAEGGTVTGTGMVVGTPLYIAPEQLGTAKVGPPADRYAFACLAFEVLAGRPPFEGSAAEVMNAHLGAVRPRISRFQPGLPPALDPLFVKALAVDPGERPGSAAALVEALAAALGPGAADPGAAKSTLAAEERREETVRAAAPTERLGPAPVDPLVVPPARPARPAPPPGRGRVPLVGVLGLVLLALVLLWLVRPRSGPVGPGPAPGPGEDGSARDPAPVRLARLVEALERDPEVRALLGLFGGTKAREAYRVWALARGRFQAIWQGARAGELLDELALAPVEAGWAHGAFALDRVAGALSIFNRAGQPVGSELYRAGARSDPEHAFDPVLEPEDRARLGRVLARLVRVRRDQALDTYPEAAEARVKALERAAAKPWQALWIGDCQRLPDEELGSRALDLAAEAGRRVVLVRDHRQALPGIGMNIRPVDFVGMPCDLVRLPIEGVGITRDDTPDRCAVTLAPVPGRDLVLGLVLSNVNNQVRSTHLALGLGPQGGDEGLVVSFRPPAPLAPGMERWLPLGEATDKRVGLAVRIRKELVPPRLSRISIRAVSQQATGDTAENAGIALVSQVLAGPLPADLDGAWDAPGERSGPSSDPCEELARIWRALAGDSGLEGAFASWGSRSATAADREALALARSRLRAWGGKLREALAGLPGGPPTPACQSDLAWLHLADRLLSDEDGSGVGPVFPPGKEPGIEAVLGKGVRFAPMAWYQARTQVDSTPATRAAAVEGFLAAEAAQGRSWTRLRSLETLNSRLMILNPLGRPYQPPLDGFGVAGSLIDAKGSPIDALETVPTVLQIPLVPAPKGPLTVAFAISDWNALPPARVLRAMIKGRDGNVEATFVPPPAAEGKRPEDPDITYQIQAFAMTVPPALLPDRPSTFVLSAHGLQPFGDGSVTVNVRDAYQLIGSGGGPE